jgi:hypothetical protein
MLGFLLFATTDPSRIPPPARRAIAAGLTVLFAVRMAVLADVWTEHRRDLAQLRAVIAGVPPGSTVAMTNVPPPEAPAYWAAGPRSRMISNGLRADYHMPALLLIERGAFWPVLFANPAQQPIRLRPAYDALARAGHDLPSHADLVANPDSGSASLRQFGFLLMLEAGADPDPAGFVPHCLTLQKRTDFAALFAVRHDATGCGTAPP